jgi:hypothetical protein
MRVAFSRTYCRCRARRSAAVARGCLPADLRADWALKLLLPPALSCASVAQTADFNTGWYASFPVLLAVTSLTFWYVDCLETVVARFLMVRMLQ